jgi:AraC-like DNA-binding protein
MELGADDYLIKPSTAEELLGAIAARLEKQAALRQWFAAESQQVPESSPADTARPTAPQLIFPSVPQLSKVFHFIEVNYHQPITLSNVAQAVGYSSAYLTDLVRRQTGQTVHQWIVKRRMAAAHSLLRETNQAVNKIAEAVGYQDAGHFSRQFRQFYGMPPNVWRNTQRR